MRPERCLNFVCLSILVALTILLVVRDGPASVVGSRISGSKGDDSLGRIARDTSAIVDESELEVEGSRAALAATSDGVDEKHTSVVVATKAAEGTKKPLPKEKEAHIIIVKGPLKNILNKKNRNAINRAINKGDRVKAAKIVLATVAPAAEVEASEAGADLAPPSGSQPDSKNKVVVATTVEKGPAGSKAKKVTTTKVSKDAERPDKPVTVESVTEESNQKGQPSKITISKVKITPSSKKPALAVKISVAKAAKASPESEAKAIVESSVANGNGDAAAEAKAKGANAASYRHLCEGLPEPVRAFCMLIPSVVAKNVDHEMAALRNKANGGHKEAGHIIATEKRLAAPASGITATLVSEKKPLIGLVGEKKAALVVEKKVAPAGEKRGAVKILLPDKVVSIKLTTPKPVIVAKVLAHVEEAPAKDNIVSVDNNSRSDAYSLADEHGAVVNVGSRIDTSVMETESGAEVVTESKTIDLGKSGTEAASGVGTSRADLADLVVGEDESGVVSARKKRQADEEASVEFRSGLPAEAASEAASPAESDASSSDSRDAMSDSDVSVLSTEDEAIKDVVAAVESAKEDPKTTEAPKEATRVEVVEQKHTTAAPAKPAPAITQSEHIEASTSGAEASSISVSESNESHGSGSNAEADTKVTVSTSTGPATAAPAKKAAPTTTTTTTSKAPTAGKTVAPEKIEVHETSGSGETITTVKTETKSTAAPTKAPAKKAAQASSKAPATKKAPAASGSHASARVEVHESSSGSSEASSSVIIDTKTGSTKTTLAPPTKGPSKRVAATSSQAPAKKENRTSAHPAAIKVTVSKKTAKPSTAAPHAAPKTTAKVVAAAKESKKVAVEVSSGNGEHSTTGKPAAASVPATTRKATSVKLTTTGAPKAHTSAKPEKGSEIHVSVESKDAAASEEHASPQTTTTGHPASSTSKPAPAKPEVSHAPSKSGGEGIKVKVVTGGHGSTPKPAAAKLTTLAAAKSSIVVKTSGGSKAAKVAKSAPVTTAKPAAASSSSTVKPASDETSQSVTVSTQTDSASGGESSTVIKAETDSRQAEGASTAKPADSIAVEESGSSTTIETGHVTSTARPTPAASVAGHNTTPGSKQTISVKTSTSNSVPKTTPAQTTSAKPSLAAKPSSAKPAITVKVSAESSTKGSTKPAAKKPESKAKGSGDKSSISVKVDSSEAKRPASSTSKPAAPTPKASPKITVLTKTGSTKAPTSKSAGKPAVKVSVEGVAGVSTKAPVGGESGPTAAATAASASRAEADALAESRSDAEAAAAESRADEEAVAESRSDAEASGESRAESEASGESRAESETSGESRAEASGESRAEASGESRAESEASGESREDAEALAESRSDASAAAAASTGEE